MADVFYSVSWMGKADGEVVTYNGGTHTIGVDAFGDYERAYEAGEVVLCDFFLDSTWIAADYQDGDVVTVTLPGGGEAEATLGVNAYLLDDATAASDQSAVTWAANQARAKGSAVYLNGGSFFYAGSQYSGSMFADGAKVYISNSYVQRITNGKTSGAPAMAPETYVLAGAQVDKIYMTQGATDKAYAYIGKDGYVAGISPLYSGSLNEVEVVIDGGSFGSYTSGNVTLRDKLTITVKNGVSSGTINTGVTSGDRFDGLACDINYTLTDSTLTNILMSGRSVGSSEWYKSFNAKIGDLTIDLTNSTISTVKSGNNLAWWCFKDYSVILDHSTITTLTPKSGGIGSLAFLGGTAVVTGGQFVTKIADAPTYGEENVETVWTDGDIRYLTGTVTKNADGSVTITDGVFFNAAAETGYQWIKGATAVITNATQNKFSLDVKGSDVSYVKTMTGIETITIDAAATLSLGSDVGSGIAITIDATDFILEEASKVVLTTTGSISATNLSILENGIKSEKYILKNTGKTLEIIEKPIVYSAKWADLADGTVITYGGSDYTIGVDAFGNYATAKATGKTFTNCDVYFSSDFAGKTGSVEVVLDGETVSLPIGEKAFTTLAAAQKARDPEAAIVIAGGEYSGDSSGSFTLNASSPTILLGGIYTGTIFAGVAGGTIDAIDLTVDGAKIDTLAMDRYVACTGPINVRVKNGSTISYLQMLSWTADTANSTFTVEDSTIGNIYTSTAAASKTIDLSLTNVTVTGMIGGAGSQNASHNNGDINFVFDSVTNNAKANSGFSAARGHDSSNWKPCRVYGDITVLVKGGTSNFKLFDVAQYQANSIAVTIDADATLVTETFTADANQTITIDVTDFAFDGDDVKTVVTASYGGLTGYHFVTSGISHDDFSFSITSKEVKLVKKEAYFSSAWVGLEDGTVVATPGGTGTIGYDAFVKYDDAKSASDAKGWNLKSADRYYSAEWKDLAAGTPVTIINASGTISTKIGDAAIPAYATLAAAQSAVKSASNATLAIVGGTTAMGGRNNWNGIANTILTSGSFTGSANGGIVTMFDGGVDKPEYEGTFTVGEGGYLGSIGITGNDDPNKSIFKQLTYNAVDGGRIGTVYIVGYNSEIVGDLDINVSNEGVISQVRMAVVGGAVTGNVNFNISDGGKINNLFFQPTSESTATLSEGSSINITLDGGTVASLEQDPNGKRAFVKEAGSSVNVLVKGTSTSEIGAWSNTYVDTLTINVGATLALGGAIAYPGTITIDASTCDYSQVQYLLMTGFTGENTITVVNDDPTKDYEIVTDSGKVFYQLKPVYFSTLWESKEEGDTVTLGNKTLTIGTDAFGTYSEVPEMKRPVTTSADTYLNSNYTAESTIVLDGGYTTTLGVDAFNSAADAFSRAQGDAKGGKLFVTGGSFTALENMNVENIEITDIDITNSITLASGAALAQIDAKVDNARNMNYLYIVTGASTVAGNVNAEISNVTDIRNACYAVTGTTVVGGDLTLNISGSKFIKGVYAIETNAEVKGDVQVFLENTEVYRKGLMIRGKADRTAEVTILGESAVSTFLGFTQVAVAAGAVLRIEAGDGEWGTDYYTALNDVINDGAIYFNHEIAQNAYMTVAGNASKVYGNGISTEIGNVIFTTTDKTGIYAAAEQENVYINSDWSGSQSFDLKDFGDQAGLLYGVSAFASIDDAKSMMAEDAVAHVAGKVDGEVIGDGKLAFSGSTVTGNVYAQGELTVNGNAENSFSSLIGGGKGSTVVGESIVTIDTDKVTGKAIVGSSYLTTSVADIDSTSTVIVNGGSFSNALIGGALVNGDGVSVSGELDTNVTLAGGTVKVLGGGCYLQGAGSAKVAGTSNVTIEGGVVAGHVFGGSFANKMEYATTDAISLDGSINVTIDTTNASVVIGGNLVAGNYGKGSVSGNTTLTFKGSNALTINGHITGDCSGGSDTPEGRFVAGTRKLAFDGFNGSLGTEGMKLAGFDAVALNGGDVEIASYGMLFSVSDWSITDGTLTWLDGVNDFSGDKLSLVSSSDIGDEGWTVFELGKAGLATGWDQFTLDDGGDAKISLSINGVDDIAVWDEEKKAYIATDYKFYKEDNALKVAKLA